jgi:hypothetical protein
MQEHGFNAIGDKKSPQWQQADTNKVYNTSQALMIAWETYSPGLRAELIGEMNKNAKRFKSTSKVYGGRKTRVEASGEASDQSE